MRKYSRVLTNPCKNINVYKKKSYTYCYIIQSQSYADLNILKKNDFDLNYWN